MNDRAIAMLALAAGIVGLGADVAWADRAGAWHYLALLCITLVAIAYVAGPNDHEEPL